MGKVVTNDAREVRAAEEIWLNYFNRYLFEHGTISEKEYKRMTEKIVTRVVGLNYEKQSQRWSATADTRNTISLYNSNFR